MIWVLHDHEVIFNNTSNLFISIEKSLGRSIMIKLKHFHNGSSHGFKDLTTKWVTRNKKFKIKYYNLWFKKWVKWEISTNIYWLHTIKSLDLGLKLGFMNYFINYFGLAIIEI
jgi:hypothetical protein